MQYGLLGNGTVPLPSNAIEKKDTVVADSVVDSYIQYSLYRARSSTFVNMYTDPTST